MKIKLLFWALSIAPLSIGQVLPTPVYSHDFTGTLTSTGFTANSSGISLTTDRNNALESAALLAQGHGELSLNIQNHKTDLMQEGSISLWFKYGGTGASAFGSDKPLVFWSNGNSSYSEGVVLATTSSANVKVISYRTSTVGGNAVGNPSSGTSDITGSWHHFAVTWKFGTGGFIKGYMDGEEVVSRNHDFDMAATALDNIIFTGFRSAYPNSLYGSIDEIKVFTEALNEDQVMSLYQFCSDVVNIPDVNFKNALLNHSPVIDTNGDGKIQCSEAAVVTTLSLNSKNISDLTGLEAFTSLEVLQCNRNQLTNIDVRANKLLVGIDCHYNQLTSLDLQKNTALVYLTCNENELTSLNLSANLALENLICSDNQITTLDLSGNAALNSLQCQRNLLTELNIANGNNTNFTRLWLSSNPNLTCIQVDDDSYSNSNWLTTNFSKDATASWSNDCSPCIVNIPDAGFKNALRTHNPRIDTNFDGEIQCDEAAAFTGAMIVTFKGIQNLTGIEAFTNITSLYCGNNSLTSLDVSANTALENLQCYDNMLSSLDVSANTELRYLIFFGNQLTNIDISENTKLMRLTCNNNQLTSLNLGTSNSLQELYCENNQITTLDLSGNTGLLALQCQNNALTTLNLANGNNTNFTKMHAHNNSGLTCIQVDNASYSNSNWMGSNFLKDATVSWGNDCTPCIVNIPDANFKNALLNHNPRIDTNYDGEIQCNEAIAFTGGMGITAKGISDLTGIEAFTDMTTLNCAGNQLTSLDVTTNTLLHTLLCNNNQLTTINVSANTALLQLQCYNNRLTSIDVSGNTALMYLFCDNNQLTSLDVSPNTELLQLKVNDNYLTSLNVANGNNTNFLRMQAENNPGLTCIQVDNTGYSTYNWTGSFFGKPAGASYSMNCGGTLSVSELEKSNPVSISPNPTSGIAYLSEISDVQIFDMSGRLIIEQNNTNTIDLSKEESGVYILKTNSQNGIGVARIIKE